MENLLCSRKVEALGKLICNKCLVTAGILSAWELTNKGFFYIEN